MNIADRAAAYRTAARHLIVKDTETVTVRDLRGDDIITRLGGMEFAVPMQLRTVVDMPSIGHVKLTGYNGWFALRPYGVDTVVRVTDYDFDI